MDRKPVRAARRCVISLESGPGGLATRVVGPVAIKPGHAPLDALAKTGKAAVLDDRIMHRAQFAVAQHDIAAAIAARDVVGLPGPERGLMDPAVPGDDEWRIPVGALFLAKLIRDGLQRLFAFGDAPVVAGAREPEIQFRGVGGL